MKVDQLASEVRVPPQVASAMYCASVQVWATYSDANQIDPSGAATCGRVVAPALHTVSPVGWVAGEPVGRRQIPDRRCVWLRRRISH